MIGIVSYGGYVPVYRMSKEILNHVWGGAGKGEKAVANVDEDSLTMGVEAARDCLKGLDKASVDALYFASTTFPFKEKQSASIMAAALDLKEDILAADVGSSLRGGSVALRMAIDAVKAGSANRALVVVADCRVPYPNSAMEDLLGDGAAAFLIGDENVVVDFEKSFFITSEFVDSWRMEFDKGIKIWEDRFVQEVGYLPHLKKAITGLIKQTGANPKEISKFVFPVITNRDGRLMTTALGLNPAQVQDHMLGVVGNTGTALAPMLLVAALEESKDGDTIVFANYGDGADASLLKVGKGIERLHDRKGIKKNVASKIMLDNYGKYIKFRNLMELESNISANQRTALTNTWRERNFTYRLHGLKCDNCGKIQYPRQKYCMFCHADESKLKEIPLADKKGSLVTFSTDERAPVVDPPMVLANVAIDGGGRFFSEMTDRDMNKVKVGIPMEFTFRRVHDGLGFRNYFWKSKPIRVTE